MADVDDILKATIGELVDNFRCALLAVLPIADRSKINYQDVGTHRDWEQLAECMFNVFTRSPIESARARAGNELPLARYDIDLDDYFGMSWLTVDVNSPHQSALVRLLTRDEPFDTVQVVEIDPVTLRAGQKRTVPLREAAFVLCQRLENGRAEKLCRRKNRGRWERRSAS
jgi:hypothetical protein